LRFARERTRATPLVNEMICPSGITEAERPTFERERPLFCSRFAVRSAMKATRQPVGQGRRNKARSAAQRNTGGILVIKQAPERGDGSEGPSQCSTDFRHPSRGSNLTDQ